MLKLINDAARHACFYEGVLCVFISVLLATLQNEVDAFKGDDEGARIGSIEHGTDGLKDTLLN